ncbi:hypothetical protein CPT_Machias_084 [Staphylococcus phage Machias]|nr:hypothetical protein CPT_Machias_084 [Staphylococcus phage Machias]WPH64090.1 hypothetical protein [Staphylococcus phage vB_StaM_PB50]
MIWKISKNLLPLVKSLLLFAKFNSNKKYFKPYLAFLVFQNEISIDQIPEEYKADVEKLVKSSME